MVESDQMRSVGDIKKQLNDLMLSTNETANKSRRLQEQSMHRYLNHREIGARPSPSEKTLRKFTGLKLLNEFRENFEIEARSSIRECETKQLDIYTRNESRFIQEIDKWKTIVDDKLTKIDLDKAYILHRIQRFIFSHKLTVKTALSKNISTQFDHEMEYYSCMWYLSLTEKLKLTFGKSLTSHVDLDLLSITYLNQDAEILTNSKLFNSLTKTLKQQLQPIDIHIDKHRCDFTDGPNTRRLSSLIGVFYAYPSLDSNPSITWTYTQEPTLTQQPSPYRPLRDLYSAIDDIDDSDQSGLHTQQPTAHSGASGSKSSAFGTFNDSDDEFNFRPPAARPPMNTRP